jgi:adenosine kinase
MLVGNDYENKMIEKMTGWNKKSLLKKTKIMLTTLGGRGSIIKTSQKEEICVEACRPKKIVDPTGAGDAYRAGLLLGLEKGYNLRMCGRLGSVVASFAIEKYGTQEHHFSHREFIRRYKTSYKEDVKL